MIVAPPPWCSLAPRKRAGAVLYLLSSMLDLSVECKHPQNLARDHLLASNTQGAKPDSDFLVDTGGLLMLRRF